MNFLEQPPSKVWSVLKYRGEKIAEVWFKPGGEPSALVIRIPEKSFQTPQLDQLLTIENLLKSMGIPSEEVESWRIEGAAQPGADRSEPALAQPLPTPLKDVSHLKIHVYLKPATQVGDNPNEETQVPAPKWQELQARWGAILGFEAVMDNVRSSMETLRSEMEASSKRMLTTEEKLHASNADVLQWNQAKSRVLFALPKMTDFVHRAIWARGTPERKRLEETFNTLDRPQLSHAQIDEMQKLLEHVLKDWQVFATHGGTVYQDCKRIAGEVESALRSLQSNAAANAVRKRARDRTKGKYF